jgi:uncharacterized lipoprotein YddW (UPF0748 family)
MKKIFALLAFVMSLSAFSQARFFTWTSYPKDGNLEAYFQELNEVGIDGLLVNSPASQIKEMIPYANKYGIEIHIWRHILCNGEIAKEHPEWLDYNRLGQSLEKVKAYVDYYKFLNPIIPGVQEAILRQLEEYATIKGVKSISLDYCRYVDAILPTGLWKKYNIVQDKVYPQWDYGYHPMMVKAFEERYGYDPRNQEDVNGDEKWHQFRMDAVNRLVERIVKMAHSHNVMVTASPFPTPKMSRRMVYQDWGQWKLDKVFPMIYNGFYYGDIEWIKKCVRECVKDAHCKDQVHVGLYTGDFEKDKSLLRKAIMGSIKEGAKGFSLFTFGGMSKELKAELKKIIATIKKK